MNLEDFNGIPLEELARPKNGHVLLMNSYWLVHEGKALFYEQSPQCHQYKEAFSFRKCVAPDVSIEFVEQAFVTPRQAGYF